MPLSPETGLGPDKNPEIVFPFPAGDRESKEEPMSEFRRDDTASWDAQEVRQAQGARREPTPAHHSKSRHRRRRRNSLAVLVGYLIFVLLASAILAGVGWMLGSDFCAFNRGALRETSVEVTAEDSVSTVADKLQDAGLIKYKWFFKLYAGISHADKKIGIGTYTLNTEMDYRALILGMHNSSGNLTAETVTVTIPEGYTVRQTIRLLAEKGVNTEENLLEAARTATYDYSFINNNSEDPSRLEGYLFPDTYEFFTDDSVYNYVNTFYKEFDAKTSDLWDTINEKGTTMNDVVILASFIQEEAGMPAEDAKVSACFHNRLESDDPQWAEHKLESNASSYIMNDSDNNYLWNSPTAAYYGWPEQGAIPDDVLAHYDTYRISGLPAGAITNPGIDAIAAALNPDQEYLDEGYYFFVTGNPNGDHPGEYFYAKTADEHHQNCIIAGWG